MKSTIDLMHPTGRLVRGKAGPLHARLLIADGVLREVTLGGVHARTGATHWQLVLAGPALIWLRSEAAKRLPPPKPPALARGGPT